MLGFGGVIFEQEPEARGVYQMPPRSFARCSLPRDYYPAACKDRKDV